MAKPINKIKVRCPHCGGEQLEPELAKSTFCRSCSQYFAVTTGGKSPAAPPTSGASLGQSSKPPVPLAAGTSSSSGSGFSAGVGGAGLLQKLEGYFGKPKVRVVQCFDCTSTQEVSGNSVSTTCRGCGAYIDLQDYKISGSFSRNIKTRGSIYLGIKGDLSSNKVICTDAVIHGKMRGSMYCSGKVIIRYNGRLQGTLEADTLLVEKGSEIVFSRPVKVGAVTIAGKMNGQIISRSHIVIHKTGALEGAAIATGFNVERGGLFQGELTISPPGMPLPEPGADGLEKPVELPRTPSKIDLGTFVVGERSPLAG